MGKSVPFEAHHLEFLKDPERARVYLEVALEEYEKDHDSEAFLLALRDVAEAQGGLGQLAKRASLNRGQSTRLYPEKATQGWIRWRKLFAVSVSGLPSNDWRLNR